MTAARPRLAVTLGDPNGIGPEVALKALADSEVGTRLEPVLVGAKAAWAAWAERLDLEAMLDAAEIVEPVVDVQPHIEAGALTPEGGRLAMRAVETAVDGCLAGTFDGMVTAPISKEAIRLAGYAFPGHTEFLAERTGADHVVMLLASGALRVALVTIHEPLADVAALVTPTRIRSTLETLDASLQRDFGLVQPRLAVLGLNPHAGDGGVIGREELDFIAPTLAEAQRDGLAAHGPFAADGFFGQRAWRDYDAVVAMYHDQGLAPFKALAMGAGVNVTCGLPIVRTSPDHGTAFGIAGQGIASADSMKAAVLLAAEMAERRRAVG